MKLRWKLLLILMLITILPLLGVRLMTKQTSHELVEDMTSRSRETLIKRAETDLLRRMEDHARIVGRERQIVNLALKNQSGRLRQVLEGKQKRIGQIRDKGLVESTKHFSTLPDGTKRYLQVNWNKIRIDLTHDATVTMEEAQKLLTPMIRSFRKLEKSNSDLIYWQVIRLTNGIIATYPYYEPLDPQKTHANWMIGHTEGNPPPHLKGPPPSNDSPSDGSSRVFMHKNEFPPHDWYRAAQNSPAGVMWTSPYRDPVTGRFIVAAVNKIKEFKGDFKGAILVMVPLGTVLKGDLDLTGLSKNITSLFVRPSLKPNNDIALQVVAEERKGESTSTDRGGWMAGADKKWLEENDSEAFRTLFNDIKVGESGLVQMDYQGKNCLWVYAPIRQTPTALVLVVPMENIVKTTIDAEMFVKTKIEDQFLTISALIWGIAATTLIISLILSKTMTKRITNLVSAFSQLALGDFSTRVDVRGKDELSDLSNTFNQLAPSLEEQVRLKEALTIAQEVQRSLLPDNPPQVQGLDVAGMSMYCEDTGGDYFDYPHLGIEADELGLAVGDVSGHGVPAALLMTTARAFLRQRAQSGGNLGSVVSDANSMLAEDVRLSGRFMTLFLFAIDLQTHTARWVRAGHDPALVYLPSKDSFSELGGDTGLPLGVDGEWEYVEEHADLEEGSVILIGTDGIWEATNMHGDMYGKERLSVLLRDNALKSSQDILDAILNSLKDFTSEVGFDDDVTLAVVKILDNK